LPGSAVRSYELCCILCNGLLAKVIEITCYLYLTSKWGSGGRWGFGVYRRGKPVGFAPNGLMNIAEERMGTHTSRWCSMVTDVSGELRKDRFNSYWFTAFTRQGSEVQILSRLPGKTGRKAVHWMAFLFLKWEIGSPLHGV